MTRLAIGIALAVLLVLLLRLVEWSLGNGGVGAERDPVFHSSAEAGREELGSPELEWTPPSGSADRDVVERAGEIRIRVLLASGVPCPDAVVELRVSDGSVRYIGRTLADGSLQASWSEIGRLAGEEGLDGAWLGARNTAHGTGRTPVEPGREEAVIELTEWRTALLKIVDVDHNPIASAQVRIVRTSAGRTSDSSALLSSDDGEVFLSNLPPGWCKVHVQAPRFGSAAVEVLSRVREAREPRPVVLGRGLNVALGLSTPHGAGDLDVSASLSAVDGRPDGFVWTAARTPAGSWLFRDVAHDVKRFRLDVAVPGYVAHRSFVTGEDIASGQLRVGIEGGRTIAIRTSPLPADARVRLRVRLDSSAQGELASESSWAPIEQWLDPSGVASVPGCPASALLIQAELDGQVLGRATLPHGASTEVELSLPRLAAFHVDILDSRGSSIGGVADFRSVDSVSLGNWAIQVPRGGLPRAVLPIGTYAARVRAARAPDAVAVHVEPDVRVSLVNPSRSMADGALLDAGGTPIEGWLVMSEVPAGVSSTDAHGRFRLEVNHPKPSHFLVQMPFGPTVWVEAEWRGDDAAQHAVLIVQPAPVELRLVTDPEDGSIDAFARFLPAGEFRTATPMPSNSGWVEADARNVVRTHLTPGLWRVEVRAEGFLDANQVFELTASHGEVATQAVDLLRAGRLHYMRPPGVEGAARLFVSQGVDGSNWRGSFVLAEGVSALSVEDAAPIGLLDYELRVGRQVSDVGILRVTRD